MISSIRKALRFLFDWKNNKPIFSWLLKISKSYRRYIFGFLLISLSTMLVSLASSIAGRYLVDAATGMGSQLFFSYILIMLGTTVLSILIATAGGIFSSYVHEKFAFEVRIRMFDRVQRSAWLPLKQYHSGDLLARLTGDIEEVASGIISIAPNALVTLIQLVLVLVILLHSDPALALIGLVIGPLGAIAAVAVKKKYSLYQQKLRESHSEYYAFLQESLSNIGVIKTFQLESRNLARMDDIRAKRMKLVLKSAVLHSVMNAGMRLIYGIGYVAAFSWCAWRLTTATVITGPDGVQTASYTYGTMTLFLSLVSQVQTSIRSLGGILPKFYALTVSARRIRQITELEEEKTDPEAPIPSQVSVRVQDVSVTYDEESGKVLDQLSFQVPAGCRVGITGTSGAGKTTLIRLLLALLKPQQGQVLYTDEAGNTQPASPACRSFITYVPQGNTLLSGSVRSNLLSGNPNATDQQMWHALEMADAADFVRKAPEGLDTVLSESAGGISEGQAQRVAIARALLRDRPVLILDEATSALDEETEQRVFDHITGQCHKTCFIITHRRSMLRYCHRVLHIGEDGKATYTPVEQDETL